MQTYLAENGFGNDNIALPSSQITRDSKYAKFGGQEFQYSAYFTYVLHTDKVRQMEKLIGSLIGSGINEILSIRLVSTDLSDLEDQARQLAIADALQCYPHLRVYRRQMSCASPRWRHLCGARRKS